MATTHTTDLFYLHQALTLAKIRRGFCSPNPSVGAVIIRDNKILSTGFHLAAGSPHAEIDALSKLSESQTDNATIYITLEPCCHHGKTPPCTEALIKAKIKRVVYAYKDPNPIVAGKGQAQLIAAGIQCEHIPLTAIDAFYASYKHWHQTKRPFITAKIAMTLDNKIAAQNNKPLKITSKELNEFTHQNRKETDAILTTAKTIIHDNPQLNARINNQTIPKPLYILDSQLTLPHNAQIFKTAKSITIFYVKDPENEPRQQQLTQLGVRCIAVEPQPSNLNQIIQIIGQDGIHDLWIEAGARCFNAFVQQNLLQRAFIYISPWSLGAPGIPAFMHPIDFRQHSIQWHQMGQEIFCDIYYKNIKNEH